MEKQIEDDKIIEKVDEEKRNFIKKAVIGTAFALPVINSLCSCSNSENDSTPTGSTYIIVKNGTVYINSSTTAYNLIVKDGVVLEYNGDESKYLPLADGIVDLKGGFACPGFHDSHDHLMEATTSANGVILNVNWTPDEVIQAVAAKAVRIRDGHPIIGDGFSYVQCSGWSLTDLANLDDAAGNHPVP